MGLCGCGSGSVECLTCLACPAGAHLHFKLRSASGRRADTPVLGYMRPRTSTAGPADPCRRRTTQVVEEWSCLSYCGTDCTYGAWAWVPFGDTGPITQQSTSGLHCQVTAVAAGGVEGVGASIYFLSFCLASFDFLGAWSRFGRYAPTGDAPRMNPR